MSSLDLPKSFSMSVNAPCKFDREPLSALLCCPSIPWNLPPSAVADLKASSTIFALTDPALISSLSVDMALPVFALISVSGLNPALIICSRSCPISLPVALICENARVSELNLSRFPIEMSPMDFSIGITFSSSMLKPSIVCAPCARSSSRIGVLVTYWRICPNSSAAFVSLPRRVANETSRLWISERTFIISLMNDLMRPIANVAAIVPPTPLNTSAMREPCLAVSLPIPAMLSLACLACTSTLPVSRLITKFSLRLCSLISCSFRVGR